MLPVLKSCYLERLYHVAVLHCCVIVVMSAGHTFCSVCIQSHTQRHKKRLCPCCREVIQSQVELCNCCLRLSASLLHSLLFQQGHQQERKLRIKSIIIVCRLQMCLCSSSLPALQPRADSLDCSLRHVSALQIMTAFLALISMTPQPAPFCQTLTL